MSAPRHSSVEESRGSIRPVGGGGLANSAQGLFETGGYFHKVGRPKVRGV